MEFQIKNLKNLLMIPGLLYGIMFYKFNKTEDGQYIQLEKKNVDTIGIERTITAVNNTKKPHLKLMHFLMQYQN